MSILSPVGRVSKLFGLEGGVLVNLYDTFPRDIDTEEPLFVKLDGLAVPLFTEHFERRGQKGALVRFADIDNTARAEELLGQELFLSSHDDSGAEHGRDDGEIFFEDLVGYSAMVAEQGGTGRMIRGTVTAFIDSRLNPLLELEAHGAELFIPAADEFIESIDTAAREISFVIPEGLLDLYI